MPEKPESDFELKGLDRMIKRVVKAYLLINILATILLAIFAKDFIYFPILLMIFVYIISLIRIVSVIAIRAYDILEVLELLVENEKAKGPVADQKLNTLWAMLKDSGSLN